MEIQQQTKTLVCKPQIRDQLNFVNGRKLFDGFHFENDQVFDQQVDAIDSGSSTPL